MCFWSIFCPGGVFARGGAHIAYFSRAAAASSRQFAPLNFVECVSSSREKLRVADSAPDWPSAQHVRAPEGLFQPQWTRNAAVRAQEGRHGGRWLFSAGGPSWSLIKCRPLLRPLRWPLAAGFVFWRPPGHGPRPDGHAGHHAAEFRPDFGRKTTLSEGDHVLNSVLGHFGGLWAATRSWTRPLRPPQKARLPAATMRPPARQQSARFWCNLLQGMHCFFHFDVEIFYF